MLAGRGDINVSENKYLYVSSSLFFSFFLGVAVLTLIFFLSSNLKSSKTSSLFKNKEIFSDLDKAKEIFFTIKLRESLDKGGVHRLYFRVETSRGVDDKSLMAVAQRIVKETISREYCHALRVDFGQSGYVDFAPYGEWERAGETHPGQYEKYKFKYVLNPILSLNKN